MEKLYGSEQIIEEIIGSSQTEKLLSCDKDVTKKVKGMCNSAKPKLKGRANSTSSKYCWTEEIEELIEESVVARWRSRGDPTLNREYMKQYIILKNAITKVRKIHRKTNRII